MIKIIKNKLLVKFILRSALVLLGSVAVIEYLTYNKTAQIIETQTKEQQRREVAKYAGDIERLLEQLSIDTKIVAKLPAVEDMLINTQYDLRAEANRMLPLIDNFLKVQLQRNKNYQQVGICGPNGQLIHLFPASTKPLSDLKCQREPSTGLMRHGAQSLVYSQRPISRNDKPIGSAFVVLNISETFDKIASEHILDTGFLALLDEQKQLLTRLERNNQIFAEHFKTSTFENRELSQHNLGSKVTFIYTQEIVPLGWRLYAVVYAEEMFADLWSLLQLITFVVLMVFLVEVIFLSYFTNALIIKPINSLLKAIDHILQGNFNHTIVKQSSDEIGKLTGSFNKMTQTIDTQMTELKHLNQKLKLIYSIFESGKEGIVVADDKWQIIDINRAFINSFGFSKQDILIQDATSLLGQHQDLVDEIKSSVERHGNWQGEILLYAKSGKSFPQLCSVNQVQDLQYQTSHYLLLFSDISQLKETQRKLEKLAHFDELTGLYNRYQFNIMLHMAIDEARESDGCFALFFVDLDNFKYVNDTMGHDIGDGYLRAVAQRLKGVTRSSDVVSRFGGDEFVLLLKNLREHKNITILADKIREVLNARFGIENKEIYPSASIGIALYPQDAQSPTELLKAADIAMYSAKESGKNAYQFFMPEMNKTVVEKLHYEAHLAKALKQQEFEYHYQIKHDTRKSQTIKAEALIRWRKQNGQMVRPDEFISVAEESGIIVPISYQVFTQGCHLIQKLRAQFDRPVEMSFNLSGRQFRQHDLAHRLFDIAKKENIPVECIEFEITESVIMTDPHLAKVICHQLKNYGFKLSMDDFGTGYSSLSYINNYPIDCIKVDRAFVTDIQGNITSQAIINAVLSIAKSLSLDVLCEGVETEQELDFLTDMGVNQFQGYYFSKPLDETAFIHYLQQTKPLTEDVNLGATD